MSEDPEKSKSDAKFSKAELEITWEHYGNFVSGDPDKLEIEVVNHKCLVKKPGIYKLISQDESELYVGEAQIVLERLKKYRNAHYEYDETKEKTDRRIQGWMLNLIKKEKGPIEIWVCTEAPYLCQDGKKLQLDLGGKTNGTYNRVLIEHIEIANNANKFRIQNDPCNWERNKEKCTSRLNDSLKLANC
jgi:hypothetical protein